MKLTNALMIIAVIAAFTLAGCSKTTEEQDLHGDYLDNGGASQTQGSGQDAQLAEDGYDFDLIADDEVNIGELI
ncbi:hypothetical protein JXB31_03170 [Candidatus Woesearchaeota archaeon]|nr:hypothetical protein [Candidatus Woesearchaeota archaeon]